MCPEKEQGVQEKKHGSRVFLKRLHWVSRIRSSDKEQGVIEKDWVVKERNKR